MYGTAQGAICLNFRKRCLISTGIYLVFSLLAWMIGSVPAFPFFICGGLYVGSAFLFAWMCVNDFKKDMRVVYPHLYRNWANLMRENDFHPDRKRKILEQAKKEMLQSPNRTEKTQVIVEELGWFPALVWIHYVLMAVIMIVMAVNGKLY